VKEIQPEGMQGLTGNVTVIRVIKEISWQGMTDGL